MKIAFTMANRRGGTDLLLREVAQAAMARGMRLVGIVQINSECAGNAALGRDDCDMDVQVLPDGPAIRISQSLGAGSSGCRLDSRALEEAAGLVAAALEAGADALIVNKFGKTEAEGRGLRPVIAEALSRDIPVLVGLNGANAPAFAAFAAGLAEELPPEAAALGRWLDEAVKAAPEAV